MFSGKKIKENVESELSGNFELKLVVKNGSWVPRDPLYISTG